MSGLRKWIVSLAGTAIAATVSYQWLDVQRSVGDELALKLSAAKSPFHRSVEQSAANDSISPTATQPYLSLLLSVVRQISEMLKYEYTNCRRQIVMLATFVDLRDQF